MFHSQMDYRQEAESLRLFAHHFRKCPQFIFPQVYHATQHVLIMSYEPSTSAENILHSKNIQLKTDVMNLMEMMFFKMIVDNYIHGDLHIGNWGYRIHQHPDKGKIIQLVIYDTGMTIQMEDNQVA